MRLQKIGNHYRAYKRTSPNWKGNTGNASVIETMEMTPAYKLMIDEAAKVFGGLDICALDLLHSEVDGREYILELNDTAIGLVHKFEEEDMMHMRDVVRLRMEEHFLKRDGIEEEIRDDPLETIKLLTIENERLKEEIAQLKAKARAAPPPSKKILGIF
jgi:hypothetical protein